MSESFDLWFLNQKYKEKPIDNPQPKPEKKKKKSQKYVNRRVPRINR